MEAVTAPPDGGAARRLGFRRAIEAVARHEPRLEAEVLRTSDVALRDFAEADPAWSGGLLNRNGAPLEFSFSTASDDLRYTVELGGPLMPPGRRLARAGDLLDALGAGRRWDGVARRFPALQRGAEPAYGGWLGIRHARAPGRATTFKIYAEVPAPGGPAAAALTADYLGDAAPFHDGDDGLRLVLVGGAPGSERCEFYFEAAARRPSAAAVKHLMARAGLEGGVGDLLGLVASLPFRDEAWPDALPAGRYGFSYSVLPGGREPAFAVFVAASALAGGDGYQRRRLLIEAARRGWSLGPYADLTAPLAPHPLRSAHHNMLTFSVGPDCSVGCGISVSPPPDAPPQR